LSPNGRTRSCRCRCRKSRPSARPSTSMGR
jgi:hypothetical protein